MPVNSPHPEHIKYSAPWRKMRDVIEGSRAVKAGQTLYLPRLGDQETEHYMKYVFRAQFFGATGRTATSMSGFIFRKQPQITTPAKHAAKQRAEKSQSASATVPDEDPLDEVLEDCDLRGKTFLQFCRQQVDDVLVAGRAGSLVDFSETEGRPFVTHYDAEEIINWREGRVAGRMRLTLLVLREFDTEHIPGTNEDAPKDDYTPRAYEQYRVYRLQDDGGQGAVSVDVYRRKRDKNEARRAASGETSIQVQQAGQMGNIGQPVISSQIFAVADDEDEFVQVKEQAWLKRRGQGLSRIPFVFHGPNDSEPGCSKPPLEDLADVNLSHYQTSADLENGRHMSGVPTLYLFGMGQGDSKSPIVLGAGAITGEDPTTKIGFVEVTSEFRALSGALAEKQQQMAALGARMLEIAKREAEAAETISMRQSGEYASLSNISLANSQSLTQVLQWIVWWTGTDADPEDAGETARVELNMDFIANTADAQMLAAVCSAEVQGVLSPQDGFEWRQQHGFVSEDRTFAESQELIANSPRLTPGPGTGKFGAPEPKPGDQQPEPK